MAGVLATFRNHPNRPVYGEGEREGQEVPQLQLLVLSPVPERVEVEGRTSSLDASAQAFVGDRGAREGLRASNPLFGRVAFAQEKMLMPIQAHLAAIQSAGAYRRVLREDLLHRLTLEPEVPVLGELQLDRVGSRLPGQYRRLARSLARAHPTVTIPTALERLHDTPAPWLVEVADGG